MSGNVSPTGLPEEAIQILGRIIAEAYLADIQAGNGESAGPARKDKKSEGLLRRSKGVVPEATGEGVA